MTFNFKSFFISRITPYETNPVGAYHSQLVLEVNSAGVNSERFGKGSFSEYTPRGKKKNKKTLSSQEIPKVLNLL